MEQIAAICFQAFANDVCSRESHVAQLYATNKMLVDKPQIDGPISW
jgi:hypothetical protein